MRHHHGPHGPGCNCHSPMNRVVYPVRENVVHNCFERTVEHVHPSHTTVVNHHLTRNRHVYPHSTNVENAYDSVDEYGGAFDTPYSPQAPGDQVAGAMDPGNQMAGSDMTPGYGPGNQVAGATSPGMNAGPGPQMQQWQNQDQWC